MTELKTNNLSDIASYSAPLKLYDNAPGDPIPVDCTPSAQEKLLLQHTEHMYLLQRLMQVKIRPHENHPNTLFVHPDIKGKRPSPIFDTQANQCSLVLKEIIAQWKQGKKTEQADFVQTLLRVVGKAPNEGAIRKRLLEEKVLPSETPVSIQPERVKKDRLKKQKEEKTRRSKPHAEELVARRLEKLNRDAPLPHTPKEHIEKIDGIVFGTNLSRLVRMDTCPETNAERLTFTFIAPEVSDPRAFDNMFLEDTKNVHKDPVKASTRYYEELKTLLSAEQLSQLYFSDTDYKMGIAVHFINGEKPTVTPVKAKITSILPHDMIDLRYDPQYDKAFEKVAGYTQVISMMGFIKNNLAAEAGVEDSKKQFSSKPVVLAKSMANCVEIMAQRAVRQEIFAQQIPALHYVDDYPRHTWEQYISHHSTQSVLNKNIDPDNCRTAIGPNKEAFLINATAVLHRLTTGTDLLDDKTAAQMATIHHYQVKKGFRLNKRTLDPTPEAYVKDLEITKVYEEIRNNKNKPLGEPRP